MIFSGFYEHRMCSGCGYVAARSTPTSLIFFIGLAAAGSVPMLAMLKELHGSRWWHLIAVPAGELALILGLLTLLVYVRDAIRGSMSTCPRCTNHMEKTLCGMYDFAFLPTPLELVLLLVLIALHALAVSFGQPGPGAA